MTLDDVTHYLLVLGKSDQSPMELVAVCVWFTASAIRAAFATATWDPGARLVAGVLAFVVSVLVQIALTGVPFAPLTDGTIAYWTAEYWVHLARRFLVLWALAMGFSQVSGWIGLLLGSSLLMSGSPPTARDRLRIFFKSWFER